MKLARTFGLALGISVFVASMAHAASTQIALDSLSPASVDVQDSDAKWIPLNSICYSNSGYDSTLARKACDEAVKTVNLMSNDKMVFQASCAPAHTTDHCTYLGGYIMSVKALVVNAH